MKKNNTNKTQNVMDIDDLSPNNELNRLIRQVMGRRTASKIAENCGVSVSTITRIRNGENKRGIHEEMLLKIWQNRDPNCEVTLEQLMSANQTVSEANRRKVDAEYDQDWQDRDFLTKQIPAMILGSGAFIRKLSDTYEIIPGEEFFPEMSYEIEFDSGIKRKVLFITQFYSNRRMAHFEKMKTGDAGLAPAYRSHYRYVLGFEEMRANHPEHDSTELVIAFNYKDAFLFNIKSLKNLSNRQNVTLALIDQATGKFIDEACLDGRKKGVIKELGLV